jgi:hypothetical protein
MSRATFNFIIGRVIPRRKVKVEKIQLKIFLTFVISRGDFIASDQQLTRKAHQKVGATLHRKFCTLRVNAKTFCDKILWLEIFAKIKSSKRC